MANKHSRFQHIIALCNERVILAWISFCWLLYSIAAAIRSEFLPDTAQNKYQAIRIMGALFPVPLPWWIAITASIGCVWLFESSFRLHRKNLHARTEKDAEFSLLKSQDAELRRDAHKAQITTAALLTSQNKSYLESIQQHVQISTIKYVMPPHSDPGNAEIWIGHSEDTVIAGNTITGHGPGLAVGRSTNSIIEENKITVVPIAPRPSQEPQ